ncbi:MAG TPA: hypothetical protein VMF60_02320, partial [Acidimicrobiales bacterium]|nr:hypothetical protein [Acidimicrobiales bacterium]
VVYLTYVVLAVGAFIGLGRRQRRAAQSRPPAMPRTATSVSAVATATTGAARVDPVAAGNGARRLSQREDGALRS